MNTFFLFLYLELLPQMYIKKISTQINFGNFLFFNRLATLIGRKTEKHGKELYFCNTFRSKYKRTLILTSSFLYHRCNKTGLPWTNAWCFKQPYLSFKRQTFSAKRLRARRSNAEARACLPVCVRWSWNRGAATTERHIRLCYPRWPPKNQSACRRRKTSGFDRREHSVSKCIRTGITSILRAWK
jgi:hypothetical protein